MAARIDAHSRSASGGLRGWQQRQVAGNGKCGGGSKGN
jgi:hypothetical protein